MTERERDTGRGERKRERWRERWRERVEQNVSEEKGHGEVCRSEKVISVSGVTV